MHGTMLVQVVSVGSHGVHDSSAQQVEADVHANRLDCPMLGSAVAQHVVAVTDTWLLDVE